MEALYFLSGTVVLLAIWMLYVFKGKDIRDYFSTKEGKKIRDGITTAVGVGILVVVLFSLSGCAGTYGNDLSMFTGLDYTKGVSPQCQEGGVDDRSTSNIGFKANVFESDSERFRSNLKYTHHSCAFNSDKNNYDALGIELEYKLWAR